MNDWVVVRTFEFRNRLKKHSKNYELLRQIHKKSERLAKNPERIGKFLSGELHGLKSTRLMRGFRLIFKVDKKSKQVILVSIDHRKKAY